MKIRENIASIRPSELAANLKKQGLLNAFNIDDYGYTNFKVECDYVDGFILTLSGERKETEEEKENRIAYIERYDKMLGS